MNNHAPYRGIECGIVWDDSPDGYNDVYISFDTQHESEGHPESKPTDSFGIHDDEIFYYLNETELAHLFKCIAERRDKFSVGAGWWIDLVDDYSLIIAEGGDQ
jgi:hypothetical protein